MSLSNRRQIEKSSGIANSSVRKRWAWGFSALLIAAIVAVPVTQGAQDELLLRPIDPHSFGRTLRISGLADPGQMVRIEANDVVVARTVANRDGDFAAHLTLPRGDYRIRAVEDGNGVFVAKTAAYRVRHAPPVVLERLRVAEKPAVSARMTTMTVAAPSLNAPPATTTSNPITISGTSAASAEVSFYVNGRYTRQVVADGGGNFSTWVPLEDGPNDIYAVATVGSETGPASNTVQVDYTNTIPRTYAATTISTPTVWTAGSAPTYTLNGNITIAAGGSLWLQPGVTINVSGYYKILASGGEIAIRGTSAQRVSLRPATASCTATSVSRSDWVGMEATGATGRISTDYADVYCAADAVYFNGGTGSVRNSRLLSGGSGVSSVAASPAAMIAPLISGNNEMRRNTYGVWAGVNSRPEISGGNIIVGNTYGVYVDGNSNATQNPIPVVNDNSVHGNATKNYIVRSFGNPATTILDATGNWWGSADPAVISATISDRKDNTTAPLVNFGGYLGSEGGPPAPAGATLIGPITATATLPAGDYLMLGDTTVDPGVTWTLSPGVTIRSVPGTKILVLGNLVANGSSAQRVHFTSANAYPAKGDWLGIEVPVGGNASLNWARVEYATNGVYFNGGQGTISRSLIRFCAYGVYVGAKSNPTIHLGNEISYNNYGVYVRGNFVQADNPQPVLNGNSLFANTFYNYHASAFEAPKPTLDATGNWWGVATDPAVTATIDTGSASSTAVDHSGFLLAEPVPQAMRLSGFSMAWQQVKPLISTQPAEGSFTLNRAGTVTYRIVRDADGAVVRQWTQAYATPGQYTFNWNGLDDVGAAVAAGLYRAILIASDGLDPYVYDMPDPGTSQLASGNGNASYNPYLNEFYKTSATFPNSSLVSLLVTPQTGAPFYAFKDIHYPAGTHWVYWNGRLPDGTLATTPSTMLTTDGLDMRANGIYAFAPAVTITGPGAAPNIEVKSDPYLVAHSYDQVSSIVYRIDADAVVRVTLLPYGVVDPAHPGAIVLVDNVSKSAKDVNGNPIDHVAIWRGFSDTDFNAVPVGTDGAYTFTIEATLPANGQKTLYRGILNVQN